MSLMRRAELPADKVVEHPYARDFNRAQGAVQTLRKFTGRLPRVDGFLAWVEQGIVDERNNLFH